MALLSASTILLSVSVLMSARDLLLKYLYSPGQSNRSIKQWSIAHNSFRSIQLIFEAVISNL